MGAQSHGSASIASADRQTAEEFPWAVFVFPKEVEVKDTKTCIQQQ
jgi:hypothetical protein